MSLQQRVRPQRQELREVVVEDEPIEQVGASASRPCPRAAEAVQLLAADRRYSAPGRTPSRRQARPTGCATATAGSGRSRPWRRPPSGCRWPPRRSRAATSRGTAARRGRSARTPATVTAPPGTRKSSSSVGRDRDLVAQPVLLVRGRRPGPRRRSRSRAGRGPGWATHVPSNPSPLSRSLSSRTLAIARSVTSGSRRFGMNAAIPPIACAPRRWHVRTSRSVYARMNGTVIVSWARSGSDQVGSRPELLDRR